MSSLLIKGMDMPKNGEITIAFASDENGENTLALILDTNGKPIEHKGVTEIPMPHGRLIDSDAAITRLKHLYCDGCGCDCSTCPWGAFIKYLDGRPTIIEAEKYGEMS